jgi:predicted nuclease of predicted toxin-antitoxin system
MRFLLDQNVYGATERFLIDLGHDAVRISRVGLGRASDSELIRVASEEERILITRDRDFGNLVYLGEQKCGLIYLRVLPSTQESVNSELARVLSSYSEGDLQNAFVVVEPGLHRFRPLPNPPQD